MRSTALWLLLACGCAPSLSLGTPCDLTSDCQAPYVCRHQRCRVACREARDCGPGLRCVVGGDGVQVCTLDREETCSAASCPGDLVCLGGECRTECGGLAVCTSAGVCVDGACVEPSSGDDAGPGADAPSCTPRPRPICGDGLIQRCDLDLLETAVVLTGTTTGEAAPLEPLSLGPHTWPYVSDPTIPDPPSLSLAVSGVGFGVVAYVADAEREPRLWRFDTHVLGAAVPLTFTLSPAGDVISVALAEHGAEVTGYVQHVTPAADGGVSAHRLTVDGVGTRTDTLSAGAPPSTNGGRVTIVGGERAIRGTDAPLFYVTRELRPITMEPAVGAVDEMISMATYRATSTMDLGADLFLESTGSGGRVAIFRAAGPSIGIWNVPTTAPLMGGPLPSDLQTADVGALGEPSISSAGTAGTDYVVAVPVEVGGVGYVRFFDLLCPAVGPCNAPEVHTSADLQARSGRVPVAVRLVPLPDDAYGVVVLETLADGGRAVYVWTLDSNLSPVLEETRAPVVVEGAGESIVAIEAASTTDRAATVTLVVAALLRSSTRREDRVVVTGFDACNVR
jgi:hypothetical protein